MALVPVSQSTEIALPESLLKAEKHFRQNSRSESTRKEYARWLNEFVGWCDAHGRTAFPAGIETLIGFLSWLATGRDGTTKTLAASSIAQAMAAIKLAQRAAGHPIDTDDIRLKETMRGIRREIAKTRTVRQVKPLSGKQVREILNLYRDDDPKEARDKAVIALGFAGARRRSEIVSLDWQTLGTGKGILTSDERGLTIRLMVSKTRQEGGDPEEYVIPRQDAPKSCAAVDNWIKLRGIQPGQPIFPAAFTGSGVSAEVYEGVSWVSKTRTWRAQLRLPGPGKKYRKLGSTYESQEAAVEAIVAAGGEKKLRIARDRMHGSTVATLIKRALAVYFAKTSEGKKLKASERKALVAMYSGHSMRAGHVTDAFERNMPIHRIKAQTGHIGDGMVLKYGRQVSKHKENSLEGSGL